VNVYRVYGVAFETGLDLPELIPCAADPDVTIVEGRLPPLPDAWVTHWEPGERAPLIRLQWCDGYRIRYEGQVDFHVSPRDRTITIDALDCPPAALRHFLLDQVMPLMLSMSALVLHASASLIDRCAVAFTGHCGVGKSTLAAILARRGHPVLSDDALLVRPRGAHLEAVPSYAGVRLWPSMMTAFSRGAETLPVDAASSKRRLKGDLGFHDGAVPLACVYLVSPEPSSEVVLRPLSARDTAMVCLEHGFRIEQRDGAALTREMDTACDAAARVPAWRLSYPREAHQWNRVAQRIAAHVRDTVANPCCT
jgi:hypothetical protein